MKAMKLNIKLFLGVLTGFLLLVRSQKTAKFNADRSSGASWLIKAEYNLSESSTSISKYTFTSRGTRYVFESLNDVKFYFSNDEKAYDSNSGQVKKDMIELTTENYKPLIKETYTWFDTDEDGISDAWKLAESDHQVRSYVPLNFKEMHFFHLVKSLQPSFIFQC